MKKNPGILGISCGSTGHVWSELGIGQSLGVPCVGLLDLCFHLSVELTERGLPLLPLLDAIAAVLQDCPKVSEQGGW